MLKLKFKVVAAPKDQDSYVWYTYGGTKATTFTLTNGKRSVTFKSGDKFGLRPSSNGKFNRMVSDELGLTFVFTLTNEQATRLMKQSQELAGYKAGNINPTPFAPVVEEQPINAAPVEPDEEDEEFEEDEPTDVGPHFYKIKDHDCTAIIKVVLDGHEWRESLVKVLKGDSSDLRIGGAGYMSYLTPQEILSWMNKDFQSAEYLGTEYRGR